MSSLKIDLEAYAASLGFEGFGVTSTDPLPDNASRLKEWLAQGYEGEMAYMRRDPERRACPEEHLPGAKSVIVMTMAYGSAGAPERRGTGAKVSKYTSGRDYHKRIQKLLDSFVRYLQSLAPETQCRTFIDTGPLLERALAQRAGIGFVGKNTLVITRNLGSWVFLASVVTTLPLAPDAPDVRNCGSCRLCLDACPTQAFAGPFELDARKCISYLTIEHDGAIDVALREKMDGWIFGCDVCQDVCPHNRRRGGIGAPERGSEFNLREILELTEEEFQRRFEGTAFKRAGRESLVRNACVAAANSQRKDLLPLLEELVHKDQSGVVREHARWAADRLR